jgi:hypothetical protein
VVGNGCVQAVSDSTPSSLHHHPLCNFFFSLANIFLDGTCVCGCVSPHTDLGNPHSAFPMWIAAFLHHHHIPNRSQTSWDSSS